MRRTLVFLIAMLLLAPTVQGAKNGRTEKRMEKAAKKMEKELRKEGWRLFGKADTLKLALLWHYKKMERVGENAREMTGTASTDNPRRMDELHRRAELNAEASYVKARHSYIVSKAITELGLTDGGKGEFERFYVESRLNADGLVRNELNESYAMIRRTAEGQTEIMVFFIVDLNAAADSDIRQFRKWQGK